MICWGIKKYLFIGTLFYMAIVTANNSINDIMFDQECLSDGSFKGPTSSDNTATPFKQQKKPWTMIIYIAADNDLRNYAIRNIKQMSNIGSNQYVNIIVHIDIRVNG